MVTKRRAAVLLLVAATVTRAPGRSTSRHSKRKSSAVRRPAKSLQDQAGQKRGRGGVEEPLKLGRVPDRWRWADDLRFCHPGDRVCFDHFLPRRPGKQGMEGASPVANGLRGRRVAAAARQRKKPIFDFRRANKAARAGAESSSEPGKAAPQVGKVPGTQRAALLRAQVAFNKRADLRALGGRKVAEVKVRGVANTLVVRLKSAGGLRRLRAQRIRDV